MKKFIATCLILVALIAFTTKPTMAEPITLTVMAITGLTAVASLATADKAYHAVKDSQHKDEVATIQKTEDRAHAKSNTTGAASGQEKSN